MVASDEDSADERTTFGKTSKLSKAGTDVEKGSPSKGGDGDGPAFRSEYMAKSNANVDEFDWVSLSFLQLVDWV